MEAPLQTCGDEDFGDGSRSLDNVGAAESTEAAFDC